MMSYIHELSYPWLLKILIVAPVIYSGADEKLKLGFEPSVYTKFQFFYFAQDDKRTPEGEVLPGIGGMVYERLGFQNQNDKNAYIPDIIKTRRSKLIQV